MKCSDEARALGEAGLARVERMRAWLDAGHTGDDLVDEYHAIEQKMVQALEVAFSLEQFAIAALNAATRER